MNKLSTMKLESKSSLCIVTETYSPEINGVANTLNQLITRLPGNLAIQLVRPRLPKGLVTPSQTNLDIVEVASAPIPGYRELRFGFPASRQLIAQWSEKRPEAVYVATQGPLGWSAVSAARKLDIPVISGFHTNFQSYCSFYGWGGLKRLITAYLRYFHNRTARTLAPTAETVSQLRGMGIKRTAVWSRGVDCERFTPSRRDPALRAQWGVKPEQPVFLYVGRIAAEKNIELAIRAFYRAQSVEPQARMVLVGDGPMTQSLKEQHPDLIFAGVQTGETLAAHYASSDIFLFPSLTDTFGNVVLEAMASGLALVSFQLAAAGEHLEHEMSGMLATPGDGDEYCRHAISLALRPRLKTKLAKASLEKARELNWPQIIDSFQNLLVTTSQEDIPHELFTRRHPVSPG